MELSLRIVYEVEADEEHHGLTSAEGARLVGDGLVYLKQTTHTFAPIPGREAEVRARLVSR